VKQVRGLEAGLRSHGGVRRQELVVADSVEHGERRLERENERENVGRVLGSLRSCWRQWPERRTFVMEDRRWRGRGH